MQTKQRRLSLSPLTIMLVVITLALLMLASLPGYAEEILLVSPPAASEKTSNTISISDIANLAGEPLPPEDGVPEDSTQFSIQWAHGDAFVPDAVTALVSGSGTPLFLELTRENGWTQTAVLPETDISPVFTLTGISEYTVLATTGQVVFNVTQVFEDPNALPTPAPFDPSLIHVNVSLHIQRDGMAIPSGEPVYYGDTVILRGQVDNPENVPFTLQWQYDDGSGWQAIPGETGDAYSFVLAEAHLTFHYRLLMYISPDAA